MILPAGMAVCATISLGYTAYLLPDAPFVRLYSCLSRPFLRMRREIGNYCVHVQKG